MKKFTVVFFIFFLILITAFIKNSTKKIEDEIFTIQVNLKELKKDLGDMKLEFDYLSSAEKLLEYQSIYFEQQLVKKDLNLIKILEKSSNDILIKDLKILESNEGK